MAVINKEQTNVTSEILVNKVSWRLFLSFSQISMSAMILESVLVHQNAKMYLVFLRANVRMALLGTVCYANVSVLQRILQVNSCCNTFF